MALQRELWSSREQMIAEEKAVLQTLVFHSHPPISIFLNLGDAWPQIQLPLSVLASYLT